MAEDRINADFDKRVVLDTGALAWLPSPQPGVERRMLDRIGGEVARATTIVRYVPGSIFPEHRHDLGEEFLVLDGVFGDEHGSYSKGTYVRNPPGSRHTPSVPEGCTIFVKLRQMQAGETTRVVIDTQRVDWPEGEVPGHQVIHLHEDRRTGERVTMERLKAAAGLAARECAGGEELLVLSGSLCDELGTYPAGTWVRSPRGLCPSLSTAEGATFWAKRGHLSPSLLQRRA